MENRAARRCSARGYHKTVCAVRGVSAPADCRGLRPQRLRGAVRRLGLQLHELLGHLVRRALAEYPEDGPAGLVHVHPPAEGQPAGTRALPEGGLASGRRGEDDLYLVHDVFELHDRHPDQLVVPAEAVVLHPDVKLVRQHLLFVPDDAEIIYFEFSIVLRC